MSIEGTSRLALLIVGICLMGAQSLDVSRAREPETRPDLNRPFIDPEFDQWVARFERPGREVYSQRHVEKPLAMMASIRRTLKPGASVVVIDFRKIPGLSTQWVLGHVRANEKTIVQEIESAGFRLAGDNDLLGSNYFLRFVVTQVSLDR